MKVETTNPYVGLRPFEAEESLLFFGRYEQTLELLQRLHHHHFVAVVGSSGCGKSSLLRAGLIPALKAGYLVEDSDQWLIGIAKPGQNPIYNLAETLLLQINPKANTEDVTQLVAKIKEEGADALLNIISPLRKEKNLNFFLLVDQFEELFRFAMEGDDTDKKDEAIDFVNIMLELSSQSLIPVYVVITMRSDFIGDCAQFYSLPEAMNKSLFLVPKLKRQQLKKVIESPAKLFGSKVNPALSSRLLNDMGKVKDELPLLQHALMRMWEFEMNVDQNGELDLPDYEKIGGIEKALSMHADEALEGMSKDELLLTKKIFQALTAIDENGRKIRRPVLLSQLTELTVVKEEQLFAIINRFIEDKRSFLVVNKVGNTGDKVIDISHESLIRQWNTLREWVEEEGESASTYLQLSEATKLYERGKKDLLSGSELQFVLDWNDGFKPIAAWANRYNKGFEESIKYLNDGVEEYTRIQNEKLKQKERRRKRNLAIIILSAFVFFAITSLFFLTKTNQEITNKNKEITNKNKEIFALFHLADSNASVANDLRRVAEEKEEEALRQKDKADSTAIVASGQKTLAEDRTKEAILQKKKADSAVIIAKEQMNKAQANYLISSAYRNINNDPTLALNLALEAMRLPGYDFFEEDALKIYQENTFYKIIAKQKGKIKSIAFSPDGKSILTGSTNGLACLWSLKGELIMEFIGHSGPIYSVAFSPNGNAILTGSADKTARLWNLEGEMLQKFIGHSDVIRSVTFSPDGKKILTGSMDATAYLWNLQGAVLQEYVGHSRHIFSVDFSPTGDTILTGSGDKTACIWNLQGEKIQEFIGHTMQVYSVAFSPDGKSILTGSYDNTARLWNLEGEMLEEYAGHTSTVYSVTFSPDGKSILTGSFDNTARLWNLQGEMLQEFKGHTDNIYSVVFSPDGKTILTGSEDQTARLWNLKREMLQEFTGHTGAISSVTFSPDGKIVLIASENEDASSLDIGGETLKIFSGHSSSINSMSFSPDGALIISGLDDNTARLWNLKGETIEEFVPDFVDYETVEIIDEFGGYYGAMESVAFSPSGKTVLAGSLDNNAYLWNLKGEVIQRFVGHKSSIYTVAFSPDGRTILTGSEDNSARLWDLKGGVILEFVGHSGAISSVAFSPNGKTLLTASADKTARLWNLMGELKQEYKGHFGGINSAAFSPDGKTILTGSDDRTAQLSNLKGYMVQEFKGHSGGINSVAFSPDGKAILTGSEDKTARLWQVSVPLDEFLESGWLAPLSAEQKEEYEIE